MWVRRAGVCEEAGGALRGNEPRVQQQVQGARRHRPRVRPLLRRHRALRQAPPQPSRPVHLSNPAVLSKLLSC